MQIDWLPSPNFSPRHPSHPITILVIHATAGAFGGALSWLRNPQSQVSAHYLISKSGRIVQLVREHDVAWHAGNSAWAGLTNINRYSVGIELENANTGRDPYPVPQWHAAVALSRAIVQRHQIAPNNLVRHLDISPGRKTDPAGLPWSVFRSAVFAPDPPPVVAPTPKRYAAVAYAWIRDRPTTLSNRVGEIMAGAEVVVNAIVPGQHVSWSRHSSDQWAELAEGGYIWYPQLREVT